ncbi:MAG TPA: hypothetical protein VMJ32_04855 [Pirellulales bacterium]|nr:hypothetical protein [Pirellulales bacterium]
MSISTAPAACAPLKQSLAAFRAGQEKYAQFVNDVLADLETMHRRLTEAEHQVALQRQQLSELRSPLSEEYQQASPELPAGNYELQIRVAELESERQALEEELENIRARAVDMAETIAGQKRQMSEEHTQWMDELRQLRHILDKQTNWITQQSETGISLPAAGKVGRPFGPLPSEHVASAMLQIDADDYGTLPAEQALTFSQEPAANDRLTARENEDLDLASVLTQFERQPKNMSRRGK